MFRRSSVVKERSEFAIALVPRLGGHPPFDACSEEVEVERTTTRLLHGPLDRYPQPSNRFVEDNCHAKPTAVTSGSHVHD